MVPNLNETQFEQFVILPNSAATRDAEPRAKAEAKLFGMQCQIIEVRGG
jgi:hypothetical protein